MLGKTDGMKPDRPSDRVLYQVIEHTTGHYPTMSMNERVRGEFIPHQLVSPVQQGGKFRGARFTEIAKSMEVRCKKRESSVIGSICCLYMVSYASRS